MQTLCGTSRVDASKDTGGLRAWRISGRCAAGTSRPDMAFGGAGSATDPNVPVVVTPGATEGTGDTSSVEEHCGLLVMWLNAFWRKSWLCYVVHLVVLSYLVRS